MENSVLMQVDQSEQNLIEEALGLLFRQGLVPMLLHILLQVELQVLKYQVQLVLRVNDLLQPAKCHVEC